MSFRLEAQSISRQAVKRVLLGLVWAEGACGIWRGRVRPVVTRASEYFVKLIEKESALNFGCLERTYSQIVCA